MSEQSEFREIQAVSSNLKSIINPEYEDGLWIRGIVTDVDVSRSNHTFFSLVEDGYSIECVVYEWKRRNLTFELDEALEIEAFGTVKLYEQKCRLEFQVEQAQLIKRPDTTTDARVKEHLEKKGLLQKKPKPKPQVINRIAVITSRQSKVLNDFKVSFEEQTQRTDVIKLIDVPLEGPEAAHQISDAINRINKNKEADVIVLIRGGGSVSALATFNDLSLAEAIYESNIPIITGIGHQSDRTAADLVADHYAITPTAAANYLIKETLPQVEVAIPKKSQTRQMYVLIVLIGVIIILALVIFILLQNLLI